MSYCWGCERMKKLEQVTVHLEPRDKTFVSAKADVLDISKSEYVAMLIAKDRIEDERQFQIMRKVHESIES